MRKLFLSLHREELDDKQSSELRDFHDYHNLSLIFPYEKDRDYSDYYTFYLSRNPYGRIISAFFDQYVYRKNSGVEDMFSLLPPKKDIPNTFVEFLEYLKTVPDEYRDSHFKTQTYTGDFVTKKPSIFNRVDIIKSLDCVDDLSNFKTILTKAYSIIFKDDEPMYQRAMTEINNAPKANSLLYCDYARDNLENVSLTELNSKPYAPLPQYFFQSERAKKLVLDVYGDDFKRFNYAKDDVPNKRVSPELVNIPNDFDWRVYLQLNPDLTSSKITTASEVMNHYLNYGRHETNKRYYKVETPDGFDWRQYLNARSDLTAAGITSERDAVIHYLTFGRNEGTISINNN